MPSENESKNPEMMELSESKKKSQLPHVSPSKDKEKDKKLRELYFIGPILQLLLAAPDRRLRLSAVGNKVKMPQGMKLSTILENHPDLFQVAGELGTKEVLLCANDELIEKYQEESDPQKFDPDFEKRLFEDDRRPSPPTSPSKEKRKKTPILEKIDHKSDTTPKTEKKDHTTPKADKKDHKGDITPKSDKKDHPKPDKKDKKDHKNDITPKADKKEHKSDITPKTDKKDHKNDITPKTDKKDHITPKADKKDHRNDATPKADKKDHPKSDKKDHSKTNSNSEPRPKSDNPFECVLEIYGFPQKTRTKHLEEAFIQWIGAFNCRIKWVNESTALAIFITAEFTQEALSKFKTERTFFQVRPLSNQSASVEALKRARDILTGINEEPDLRAKRKNWSKYAKHIFDRTKGICYLCKKPLVFEKRGDMEGGWTIEHVFPISKYPDMDVLANLLPAHSNCNRDVKGARGLQSIATDSKFNLMTATLDIQSLHPDVKEELRKAKELHDQIDKTIDSGTSKLADEYLISYSELEFTGQTLGKGAFGDVIKAKWSGISVAVKIAHHKAFNENFEQEVGILCRLRHPNIVLLLAVTKPPDPLCIVTEYAPNGNLQNILDNTTTYLDETTKLKYAIGICRGMTYLHQRNILHLDLKPLNVLVGVGDTVKVADFGLSKVANKVLPDHESLQASNNSQVGTVVYMSPEILDEKPTIGKSADVYSFSICLYQIMGRKRPYIGKTDIKVGIGVVTGTLRPDVSELKDTHPFVIELMVRGWAQEPADRPSFKYFLQELSSTMEKDYLLKSF